MTDTINPGQANGAALYENGDSLYLEQHIFFVGVDGSLNQSWNDRHAWQSQVLPGSPSTWPIGLPWYMGLIPELHVYFRDANGALGHSWWGPVSTENNGWQTEMLPGTPTGALAAANYNSVNQSGKTVFERHVFYVEADGRLHQTLVLRGGGQAQTLPGSPDSRFGLSVGVDLSYQPLQMHVFYVQGGNLAQTWWDGNQFTNQLLPGEPFSVPRAIMNYSGASQQSVFFVTRDGLLQRSWYDGSNWQNETLPGSPLGYDLQASTFTNAAGVTELHVFFVGQGGALTQTWWDRNGWQSQDLPGRPSRLLGVGPYYPQKGRTELHVFFRADDGSLQQSWSDRYRWNNQMLPTATPLRGDYGF